MVQRGLGRQRRHRRAASVGVQLGARLQRPRHAHRVAPPAATQRPDHRPGSGLRHHQRHGAARPHRAPTRRCGRPGRLARPAASPSDLVAAIDQAVADGVDVINYSISGTLDQLPRPGRDLLPVRGRRGHLRRSSAGNSGPTTSTVAHPGPWTHHRGRRHAQPERPGLRDARQRRHLHRRLGRGDRGRPRRSSTPSAAGVAGAEPDALALCYSAATDGAAVLDPAKVAGKIVVCDRGVTARVNKSLAVQEAGGVGMILLNTDAPTRSTPTSTSCPTVHLQNTDRAAVQGLRRHRRRHGDDQQGRRSSTPPRPRTRRPSRRAARSSPAAATCSSRTSSPPARTSWPRSRRQATAVATSTSTAARRCPARTWPASRRC